MLWDSPAHQLCMLWIVTKQTWFLMVSCLSVFFLCTVSQSSECFDFKTISVCGQSTFYLLQMQTKSHRPRTRHVFSTGCKVFCSFFPQEKCSKLNMQFLLCHSCSQIFTFTFTFTIEFQKLAFAFSCWRIWKSHVLDPLESVFRKTWKVFTFVAHKTQSVLELFFF